MSRFPCPSIWTLYLELVIVSTSLVPKTPRPVLYSQYLGLTPESAWPLKVSVQASFQAGVEFPCSAADEQLRPARTMRLLSPAMNSRDQSEARVRSLASYGLSARTAVRRHIPGHPARILAVSRASSACSCPGLAGLRIRAGPIPRCHTAPDGARAWLKGAAHVRSAHGPAGGRTRRDRPGAARGDDARRSGRRRGPGGAARRRLRPDRRSTDYTLRSRRSVAADLKSDAGRELVLRLVARADVLLEGLPARRGRAAGGRPAGVPRGRTRRWSTAG